MCSSLRSGYRQDEKNHGDASDLGRVAAPGRGTTAGRRIGIRQGHAVVVRKAIRARARRAATLIVLLAGPDRRGLSPVLSFGTSRFCVHLLRGRARTAISGQAAHESAADRGQCGEAAGAFAKAGKRRRMKDARQSLRKSANEIISERAGS